MLTVGNPEGSMLGLDEGQDVGFADDTTVGALDGWMEGLEVGSIVGPGDAVGTSEGAVEGRPET
jgi:hypothetical protein